VTLAREEVSERPTARRLRSSRARPWYRYDEEPILRDGVAEKHRWYCLTTIGDRMSAVHYKAAVLESRDANA